jgi:hypothetical protein
MASPRLSRGDWRDLKNGFVLALTILKKVKKYIFL